MTEATDWGSALAILAAGLIVGAMFVYFVARRRASSPADPMELELRDLEGKRDALVTQLREELPADERTKLELETAHVLRAIDERKARRTTAPGSTPVVPVNPSRAALVGFAWGSGSILILGVLGYFVMKAAKPREGTEQTQTMQAAQPPADAVTLELEAAVKKNPEDLEARVNLAQAYLERENLMGVFEQTQYVLAKEPNHARALTFQALVRMAMGQTAESVQMLEQATKVDPMLLDAWVGLAWVKTQEGKVKEAEAAMQEAMRRRPDEKQRLEQVLAQMKSHEGVDMSKPAPVADDSLPPDHPPIGGAMPSPGPLAATATPAPAPAAAAGGGVKITLELDPAAKQRTGTIYVIVRPAGAMGGPPVAVKRLPAQFPITFDLTSADSMMGQPLPPKMRLEARLDADGDAATKNPNDPKAAQDGVATGSTVKLALK